MAPQRPCGSGPLATAALPLKVLCLHGYGQSGDLFRTRTGAVRRGLKSTCSFTFLDGPHAAEASFVDPGADKLAWWNAEGDAAARPSECDRQSGFERSMALVEHAWGEAGFDGVFAFSQGAAFGALALASEPKFAARLKFVILISGFIARDTQLQARLEKAAPIATPSLHICGATDALVPAAKSLELAAAFINPVVLTHDGGHFVPGTAAIRKEVAAFVESVVPSTEGDAAACAGSEAPADESSRTPGTD